MTGGPEDLNDLGDRVREAQRRRRGTKARTASGRSVDGAQLAAGLRIASEMLAALAVGVMLGLALDHVFETSPWLLIVFFFLGCGAAMMNVYRTSQELEKDRREAKAMAEQAEQGEARVSDRDDMTSDSGSELGPESDENASKDR